MDVVNLVIRRQVERLFPGLAWHQGVAVLTTVWLILVAAVAIALADVGSDPALAGRQVVVQMPAPAKDGSAAPPLVAAPSAPAGGSDPAPDNPGADEAASAEAAPVEEPFPSTPAGETLPPLEPEPTDPGDAGDQPEATTWKAGAEGYTVALDSFAKEAEAGGAVDAALAAGIETGSVASDGFASLRDGLFVVFSGYHATLSEARTAADDLATRGYTRAQPVFFSEKRARRCEDGEQPRQAVAEDAKGAGGGASGAAPRAAGGGDSDAATTPGNSNTAASGGVAAMTGGDSDTAASGGAGDQAGGQNEQLPVIEVPCEVRPTDEKPSQGGSSGDAGGGPAVKP